MSNASPPAVWFPTIRAGTGTDVFTERLAAALTAHGIRCDITWLPHRAEYAPWSVPVPTPPKWATAAHINSWLHPHFMPHHLPMVVTVHHSVHDAFLEPYKTALQSIYHRWWIRPIETRNLARAAAIVAVSRYTATQLKQGFGCVNAHVIHNGIDCESLFTPAPDREPHRPFRLLYVGNWIERKGVDLLAPLLERLGPDFQLLYTAGRGKTTGQERLPTNARCLGTLDIAQLVAAYQNADALVFPSRLEGFGLSAVEAMACGLPVIASRVSALPEVVEEGVTGLLCPVDDVGAFAAAARKLAESPTLWTQMRQAARERAARHFCDQRMVDDYLTVYRELI